VFQPNYNINEKILRYLTEITENRTIILNSPLIPKWTLEIRREAILNSAYASTNIEGNSLSFEEVSDLMLGRDITALKKDKQEVLNYFKALKNIEQLKNNNITNTKILDLHKIITQGTLNNPKDEGKYRSGKKYVLVGNRFTGEITFRPPPTKDVTKLMNDFIQWINSKKKINTVIEAGIVHYEFVRIHPFIDGNGRTARTLATLILVKNNFDTQRFFALDDFYNSDRLNYYKALKSIDAKTQDLTEWLEYFCEGVAVSIKAVKDKVMLLTGGAKMKNGKQITIDYRQMKIVEYIKKNNKITNKDTQNMLNVSNKTAYILLNNLIKNNIIKKIGKGRSTIYILR